MIAQGLLAKGLRDASGTFHPARTVVNVVSTYRELGTHRTLLKVIYHDTNTVGIVMPNEITETEVK